MLSSLFDFSFEHLVTFRVLRFFYILGVVLGGLFLLVLLLGALLGQSLTLLVSFVLGVGWFVLYLIGARIAAEFLVVVFRLGEDVRALRQARIPGPSPGGVRPTA